MGLGRNELKGVAARASTDGAGATTIRWRRVLSVAAVSAVIVMALLDRFTTFSGFDPASIGRTILRGLIPYRDFPLEYPPGAAAILTVPALAGDAYRPVFHALMAATWILLARQVARRTPSSSGGFLLCSVVYAFLIGAGFDIVIALFVFAAFLARQDERHETSAWWLAAGSVTKWIPVALAPLLVVGVSVRRKIIVCLVTAAALVVALGLPAVIARDGGDPVAYHRGRLLHAESTMGTLILAKRAVTDTGYSVVYEHRARGVSGAGQWASVLALVLTVVFMSLIWRKGDPRSPASWAAILLAIPAFGPVASPQFLLWPLGFAGLLPRTCRRFYLGAGALSLLIFGSVIRWREGDVLTTLMLTRNALVIGAAVTAAWAACRSNDRPETTARIGMDLDRHPTPDRLQPAER